MYFAQFFQKSTGYIVGAIPPVFGKPQPIEATGDRGVIILDGRNTLNAMHKIAERECDKRGFIGWQLFKGQSFTHCTPITSPILEPLE